MPIVRSAAGRWWALQEVWRCGRLGRPSRSSVPVLWDPRGARSGLGFIGRLAALPNSSLQPTSGGRARRRGAVHCRILDDGSRCAICREPLTRPFTAPSGCAFAPEDPLFRYCDAPLHLDCLADGPSRERFSRAYFDASIASYRAGCGALLHDAGAWFLTCGPIVGAGSPAVTYTGACPGEPIHAEVRLADWPFRLYASWRGWDAYLREDFEEGLCGAALDAATRVASEVRLVAPSQTALARLLAVVLRRGGRSESEGVPAAG